MRKWDHKKEEDRTRSEHFWTMAFSTGGRKDRGNKSIIHGVWSRLEFFLGGRCMIMMD
jgi:hypothetical protein